MRRSAVVIAIVCAGVVVAALLVPAIASAGISGMRAKTLATRIAELGPRPAASANERRAGGIVLRKLRRYGFDTSTQRVKIPSGEYSRNVLARGPGKLRVVIVAHVDGVHGTGAANDNGSGLGALVEVGRVLRGSTRGLLLAGLGAEETQVTGSAHHRGSQRLVRSLSAAERASIRLVLSLDMVGVGPTFNVRGVEAAPNRSARKALRAARERGYPASYLRDSGQSDHVEFTEAGIPAAWIEWRWDECWHQPCDRPHRLKTRKLRLAARLAVAATRNTLD